MINKGAYAHIRKRNTMKAINIKIERLTDPIGIDIQHPRISWVCDGGRVQTAYRIVALSDDITVWDTGRVESSRMNAVYDPDLHSRERVELRITLWDEDGTEGEESNACFEMGLLSSGDFKASWICGNYKVNKRKRYPADCFKRSFDTSQVMKARLYATACGIYEARINGTRVGDYVLAPGVTNYKKRIQYQTYDVTELVRDGQNTLEATLADGWYRGSCGAWGLRNRYGTVTKLWMQLELTMANGDVQYVLTDGEWLWSNDGAVRFADNKDGEIYDARLKPSYNCKAKLAKCSVTPSASNNVKLSEHERLNGKMVITPSGKRVIDFGHNIAGYVEMSFFAHEGETLHLRFGELLDRDGEFTQSNIQLKREKTGFITPRQEIIYTAREGKNDYKCAFAIFGFRYALVEGSVALSAENVRAIAVYSDMQNTLEFDSSHPLINKFVENTRWSAKNNHADLPTDCRRERGTAGRVMHSYSPLPRAISSTTLHLPASTCACYPTSRSPRARYRRSCRTEELIFICHRWTAVPVGLMPR